MAIRCAGDSRDRAAASMLDVDVRPTGFSVDCATAEVAGSPRATCHGTADGWVIQDIQNTWPCGAAR